MRSSKILVVDLDETLTRGGDDPLKPYIKESLLRLRNQGWTLVLATGRDRRYLSKRTDLKGIFDAWVTEAGLSVYIPSSGVYYCFADERWVASVKKLAHLPFIEEKENTIAFKLEYMDLVKPEISKLEVKTVLRNNKGYVIVLPEGVSKALGVKEAFKLLNVDGYTIVIGDSEIDLELFAIADFKAAVANAEQSLKEKADYIAYRDNGDGVLEIVEFVLLQSNGATFKRQVKQSS
ncbi:MAG: HAD family hydrolase [Candidatus Nezhaarchaeales archaeon]